MAIDTRNPIDVLFGGMGKLGPGSDADTLQVLNGLPRQRFDVAVDAGCGTGRQTLVLAKALDTLVHAVDSHEPFLSDLRRRAREAGTMTFSKFAPKRCSTIRIRRSGILRWRR